MHHLRFNMKASVFDGMASRVAYAERRAGGAAGLQRGGSIPFDDEARWRRSRPHAPAAKRNEADYEAGASPRSQAHVHFGAATPRRGGNMWKYIAMTIGMKTMVL
jgi:hypothetical protein